MKTVKFDGVIETFDGKPVVPALRYEGEYEAFGPDKNEKAYTEADWTAALAEANASKKVFKAEDIVRAINAGERANARQKAMNQKLAEAGYEKTTLKEDKQKALKAVIKVYVQTGMSEVQARQIAEQTMGIKLEESNV